MMKRLAMFAATAAAMMCSTSSSFAEDAAPTTIATNATSSGVAGIAPNDDPFYRRAVFTEYVPEHHREKIVGIDFSLGVPGGIQFGLAVKPGVRWLRLNADFAYNGIGPGLSGGITFDPIKYWVGPSLSAEVGGFWPGSVPGLGSKSPQVSYDYFSIMPGLEFGNRDSVRFYIRAGLSYIDLSTSAFSNTIGSTPDGTAIGDPSVHGWVAGVGKLGMMILF